MNRSKFYKLIESVKAHLLNNSCKTFRPDDLAYRFDVVKPMVDKALSFLAKEPGWHFYRGSVHRGQYTYTHPDQDESLVVNPGLQMNGTRVRRGFTRTSNL